MKELIEAAWFSTKSPEKRQEVIKQSTILQTRTIMKIYEIPQRLRLISDRQELFATYFSGYYLRKSNFSSSSLFRMPFYQNLVRFPGTRMLYTILKNNVEDTDTVANQLIQEGDLQADAIREAACSKALGELHSIQQETLKEWEATHEYILPGAAGTSDLSGEHILFQRISTLLNLNQDDPHMQDLLLKEKRIHDKCEELASITLRMHGTPQAVKNAAHLISSTYVGLGYELSMKKRADTMKKTIDGIVIIGK